MGFQQSSPIHYGQGNYGFFIMDFHIHQSSYSVLTKGSFLNMNSAMRESTTVFISKNLPKFNTLFKKILPSLKI